MSLQRVICPLDQCPRRGVSLATRLLVHRLEAQGCRFTLEDRGVRVMSDMRVADGDVKQLKRLFHEVRELLAETPA